MSKIMNRYSKIAITFILMMALQPLPAEELVVVTASDNVEDLNIDDVARIFLGKVNKFPSGEEVVPLNMDPSDPSFADFARVVLKKSPSQLKAYWAKRIFTGKGKPPRSIGNSEELRALVASDKRYLSYLDKNNVDHTVRWVIVLKQ